MQKISAFLGAQQQLASLTEQAGALLAIQKLWATIVPENLASYTQAGNIRHKRLTIYVDNGAIASKIKLLSPSLLVSLQKQGVDVTAIRVQVQVQSAGAQYNKPKRILSAQGAENVREMSERLTGSALGDALARLASRT